MTLAIIRREPAHIDREHWRYERVTTPRESWMADNRRRVERLIREMKLGDEVELPDGRYARREPQYYHVYQFLSVQAVCTRDEILPYLLDGVEPKPHEHNPGRKKGKYHGVRIGYRVKGVPRYEARIWHEDHELRIGYFVDEESAARAYDAFVLAHGLAHKPLNFPLEQQEAA